MAGDDRSFGIEEAAKEIHKTPDREYRWARLSAHGNGLMPDPAPNH
jgi:hypothetical protein